MRKIFISYRRIPDQYVAGNLGRELRRHFGESQVFRDKEDIQGGVSWRQHVLNEIDRNSVLLVLIGKDWASARDASGNRRLDNPDDPIRLEIEDAIQDGAKLIPLLLENAEMPPASELPRNLQSLSEINALKLRDGDWENDVARIFRTLENLGFTPRESSGPSPVAKKRSAKAIWSLVIVALVVVGYMEGFDREAMAGGLTLALVALGLAAFGYFDIKQNKTTGKAIAISGLAASLIMSLFLMGKLIESEAPQQTALRDPATHMPAAPTPAVPDTSYQPQQNPTPQALQPQIANAPAATTPSPQPESARNAAPPAAVMPSKSEPASSAAPAAPRTVNVAGQWRDEEEGTLVIFTQDGANVHFVATEAGIAVEGRGTIQDRDIQMTLYMANIPIGESNMKVAADSRRIQGSMYVNGETSQFAFVR